MNSPAHSSNTHLKIEFKIKDLNTPNPTDYYIETFEGYESLSGQEELLGQCESYFESFSPKVLGKTHETAGKPPSFFRLKVIASGMFWDANSAVHKVATLTFHTVDGRGNTVSKRHFSGHIMQSAHLGEVMSNRFNGKVAECYCFELCPWIWYLAYTQKSRIFKNKTIEEIFAAVVNEYGYEQGMDFEFRTAELPAREYTVEFSESDYAFLSRLLESTGWYWYQLHDELSYKLVICDTNEDLTSANANISTLRPGSKETLPTPVISANRVHVNTVPGSFAAMERDYTNPARDRTIRQTLPKASDLRSQQSISDPHEEARTLFRFNQNLFKTQRESDKIVDERVAAIIVPERVVYGKGYDIRMAAGHVWAFQKSKLFKHYFGEGAQFNLLRIEHRWKNQSYENYFIATDHAVEYQSYPHTPIPEARSIHSARVVCKDGSHREGGVDVDSHGRVYLKFWWEPTGQVSIPARVRSDRAGPGGFGSSHTPRVGTEVLVAYMNGNLEVPVVVGSVHNGTNTHYLDPSKYPNHSYVSTPSTTRVHYEPDKHWAAGTAPNTEKTKSGQKKATAARATAAPFKALTGGGAALQEGQQAASFDPDSPYPLFDHPGLGQALSLVKRFSGEESIIPQFSGSGIDPMREASILQSGEHRLKKAQALKQKARCAARSGNEGTRRQGGGSSNDLGGWIGKIFEIDKSVSWVNNYGNSFESTFGNTVEFSLANSASIELGLSEKIELGGSISISLGAGWSIYSYEKEIGVFKKAEYLEYQEEALKAKKEALEYNEKLLKKTKVAGEEKVTALSRKLQFAKLSESTLYEKIQKLKEQREVANSEIKKFLLTQQIGEEQTAIAKKSEEVATLQQEYDTLTRTVQTCVDTAQNMVTTSENAVTNAEAIVTNAETILLN